MSDSNEETTPKFTPGNIITAVGSHAGCSYRQSFARVLKVTPSGRFRIGFIGSKEVKDHPKNYTSFAISKTVIKPDLECHEYGTHKPLMKPDGFQDRTSHDLACYCWEIYNPAEVYYAYFDLGD